MLSEKLCLARRQEKSISSPRVPEEREVISVSLRVVRLQIHPPLATTILMSGNVCCSNTISHADGQLPSLHALGARPTPAKGLLPKAAISQDLASRHCLQSPCQLHQLLPLRLCTVTCK